MHPGMIVGERYLLEKQMCTAWLATDQQEGQHCILKNAASFAEPEAVMILGKVWFPGLPRLQNTIDVNKVEWHVFDYLPGRTLEEIIMSEKKGLPTEKVLIIMLQIARILDFLHRQLDRPLMHLDIKPANIILTEAGDAALIDFNSARFYPLNQPKKDCRLSCTAEYAAPEMMRNEPCPASDIYSLGLSIMQALCGKKQLRSKGQNLDTLLQGESAKIKKIIGRCLHIDPDKRHTQADELACEIALELHRMKNSILLPEAVAEKPRAAASSGDQGNILCVWDNAEFGCELAAYLSEKWDTLVIDADLLFPQADMLLDLKPDHQQDINCGNGFDLALQDNNTEPSREEFQRSLVQTANNHLKTLYSLRDLHCYEQYRHESLYQILQLSRKMFSQVVVLCSRFIYDAFTCLSLYASDMILVPLTADFPTLRSVNRLLSYLVSRQICAWSQIRYIAYPYQGKWDLSWGTMDELCGGRFYGCISQNERRLTLKNEKKAYAMSLSRQNKQEYKALTQKLELT